CVRGRRARARSDRSGARDRVRRRGCPAPARAKRRLRCRRRSLQHDGQARAVDLRHGGGGQPRRLSARERRGAAVRGGLVWKGFDREHGLFLPSLDNGFAQIHPLLATLGRLIVGFLPKERMDRMNMPTDIFTTRAPDDLIAVLTKAKFVDARLKRPTPTTRWAVIVANRG